jgi:hypothetical protein
MGKLMKKRLFLLISSIFFLALFFQYEKIVNFSRNIINNLSTDQGNNIDINYVNNLENLYENSKNDLKTRNLENKLLKKKIQDQEKLITNQGNNIDINYVNNLENLYENSKNDLKTRNLENKLLKKKLLNNIDIIFSSKDANLKQKVLKNGFKRTPYSWKIAAEFLTKNETNELIFKLVNKKKIKIYNKNFEFSKYLIPFPDYYSWKDKPISYLANYDKKIFLISPDGIILFSQFDQDHSQNLQFKTLASNIRQLIDDKDLLNTGSTSIRDILLHNDFVYVSYNKKIKDGCYTTALARASFNYKKLYFKDFFIPDTFVCNGVIAQSGGKIAKINETVLAFSIGEYRDRILAQNDKDVHGKIIKINLVNGEFKIISKGHRNVQGLYFDHKKNVIVSTEHGPKGGDEINIIKINKDNYSNYGWPISSYGLHYDGKIKKDAPLYKSHKKHGFIEPLKYFIPSIGISDVESLSNFFDNEANVIGVGALGFNPEEGDKIIHLIKLSDEYDRIIDVDYIETGERVRDIEVMEGSDCIYIVLEDTPALATICK